MVDAIAWVLRKGVAIFMLLLATGSSGALAEQMVWKVVSSSGMVSAAEFNDLKACKKALPKYKPGSTCLAVPMRKD